MLIIVTYLVLPGLLYFGLYRMEKRLPAWRRERLRRLDWRYGAVVIAGIVALGAVSLWVNRTCDSSSVPSTLCTAATLCLVPIAMMVRVARVASWRPEPPVRVADEVG